MARKKLTEEELEDNRNDKIILQIQDIVIGKYAYGYHIYTIGVSGKGEEVIRNKKYPANFTESLKMMHDRLLQKKLNDRPVEDLKNIEKLISIIQAHDEWFGRIAKEMIESGIVVK